MQLQQVAGLAAALLAASSVARPVGDVSQPFRNSTAVCDGACVRKLLDETALSAAGSAIEYGMATHNAIHSCFVEKGAPCADIVQTAISGVAQEANQLSITYEDCDDVCLLGAMAETSRQAAARGIDWDERYFGKPGSASKHDLAKLRWIQEILNGQAQPIDRNALHRSNNTQKGGWTAPQSTNCTTSNGTRVESLPPALGARKPLRQFVTTEACADPFCEPGVRERITAALNSAPSVLGTKEYVVYELGRAAVEVPCFPPFADWVTTPNHAILVGIAPGPSKPTGGQNPPQPPSPSPSSPDPDDPHQPDHPGPIQPPDDTIPPGGIRIPTERDPWPFRDPRLRGRPTRVRPVTPEDPPTPEDEEPPEPPYDEIRGPTFQPRRHDPPPPGPIPPPPTNPVCCGAMLRSQ